MKRLLFATLVPAVLLAGCASLSPEARVRAKLLDAGVKPHLANCLASKLARKLSIPELEQLGHAAKGIGGPDHHVGIHELAERLQAVDDPHIVDVVTRAGLSCAIGG